MRQRVGVAVHTTRAGMAGTGNSPKKIDPFVIQIGLVKMSRGSKRG